MLKAHGLKCVRGDTELFSNLEFSIKSGEALVVKGDNGSGKTSLLRILCGFSHPVEGDVTWCDESIFRHDSFRQQISYAVYRLGVKMDLTVLENLSFMQRLAGEGSDTSKLKELARYVGLFKQRNVLTRKLSAGQVRRVALAKLLLEQRSIWVLDEPLTALDKEFIVKFELDLKNHLDKLGLLVVTTHRELKLPQFRVKQITLS